MKEATIGATAEDGVQLGKSTGPGSKVCEEARRCVAYTPTLCKMKGGTKYKKMIKMGASDWAQKFLTSPQQLCVLEAQHLPPYPWSICPKKSKSVGTKTAGCLGSIMLAQCPCTPPIEIPLALATYTTNTGSNV